MVFGKLNEMENIFKECNEIRDIENRFSCMELLRLIRKADPEYKDPKTTSYLSLLSERSLRLLRMSCNHLLNNKSGLDFDPSEAKSLCKLASCEGLLSFAHAAFGKKEDDNAIKTIRRYILMQHTWDEIKDEISVKCNTVSLIPLIPTEVLTLYREPWLRCGSSFSFFADKEISDSLKQLMSDKGFVPDKTDPLEADRLRCISFRNKDGITFHFFFDVPYVLSGAYGDYLTVFFEGLTTKGREMSVEDYVLLLTIKLHAPNMHRSSARLSDLLDLALILDVYPELGNFNNFRGNLRDLKLDDTWEVISSICIKALPGSNGSALNNNEILYLSKLIGRPYLRASFIEKYSLELMEQNRYFDPPEFTILREKALVYLVNSKAACSSIKASMLDEEVPDDYTVHNITFIQGLSGHELTDEARDYFKFTFVRNPFSRLVSCYESKYHLDREKYKTRFSYRNYLNGYLYNDEGFDEFVRKVCALPYRLMDRHFRSQYDLIFNASETQFDFIGHFETLDADFSPIQIKYRLRPLPHLNRVGTDDWMNYYTTETANLVYQTFRKDIEAFGYENLYFDLLSFIQAHS